MPVRISQFSVLSPTPTTSQLSFGTSSTSQHKHLELLSRQLVIVIVTLRRTSRRYGENYCALNSMVEAELYQRPPAARSKKRLLTLNEHLPENFGTHQHF
jgi:hypothetical protein